METWRDVAGYEGRYQVSDLGRVRNVARRRLLNERKQRSGYVSVMLYAEGVAKSRLIHRLVAEAFLENLENKPFVNHIDENKRNNRVENLEWCTHKYNMNYGTVNHRISEKRGHGARSKRAICQKDMNGVVIAFWNSISEASKTTHTARSSIYQCCKGIHRSANGYRWEYM